MCRVRPGVGQAPYSECKQCLDHKRKSSTPAKKDKVEKTFSLIYFIFRLTSNLMAHYKDPLERFENFCMPEPMSGCVLWLGSLCDGYPNFWDGKTMVRGHRWYWQLCNGPVPTGLELDHLCRVRSCVNLRHMEAVTKFVNMARGNSPQAINLRKTHCLRGHEYTPENTYISKPRPGHRPGNRECKACWTSRYHEALSHRVAPSEPAPTASIPPR